ncbi:MULTISPECIES: ATP-grasp domain-containing protein [unclassified Streptomyces]|uniref:ATP-grasp domain-containing protein n=1 Tax=unclassified Streptomyces TaxID=2593676 RepID=UPI0023668770|nr:MULTISPECIES: ATP-grasp domain-containing protein [unclassified Streptomyces]MDF3139925.1 ATP-grasp domain-containing protein [Streptomyces sp. T21Q-yed]WDF44012.1 ATP-grasp domain-containing protein [Streptomyces sp. T12]
MVRRRILLLGGTSRLIKKVAGLNLDVVNVRAALDLDPAAARFCTEIHEVDVSSTTDVAQLVERLQARAPFDRIICHSEPLQMLSGHLSTHFGIPGNSFDTVQALRDKYRLRSLLREHGVRTIAAQIVTNEQDIQDFAERHGGAVVKPRSGDGSVGIHFVHGAEDAAAAWKWASSIGLSEMLAEEIIEGTEVSLEFFSVNGTHIPLAATTKELSSGSVELGHAVPAPLTERQFDEAARLVRAVLDVAGLTWGPSHTEVILTAHGPELVESHSRRAGGHINELVRLVYGIDMERLAFELAADDASRLPDVPSATKAAAIRFLIAEPGEIQDISGVSSVMAVPDVAEVEIYASPGGVSRGLRWSGDYAGHVIATGASADDAMARATLHASQIQIRTRGFEEVPYPRGKVFAEEVDQAFDAFDASVTARK